MVAHDGAVQIGGEGGEVTVRAAARDTKVDMRRATVSLVLGGAATVTALTTDEPLRIVLDGRNRTSMSTPARARADKCRRRDFDLVAEKSDRDLAARSRLRRQEERARVVLRNVRGDIVIGKRK